MKKSKHYVLEFELQGLPKMSNQLLRGHWRVKHAHATKWKAEVKKAVPLAFYPKQALSSAALSITRYSARCPDFDGLVSAGKPIIDGLVECGVLAGDSMKHIGQPTYRWEQAPPKKGRVVVRVESVDGGA